jgi:hypothetical protein
MNGCVDCDGSKRAQPSGKAFQEELETMGSVRRRNRRMKLCTAVAAPLREREAIGRGEDRGASMRSDSLRVSAGRINLVHFNKLYSITELQLFLCLTN